MDLQMLAVERKRPKVPTVVIKLDQQGVLSQAGLNVMRGWRRSKAGKIAIAAVKIQLLGDGPHPSLTDGKFYQSLFGLDSASLFFVSWWQFARQTIKPLMFCPE